MSNNVQESVKEKKKRGWEDEGSEIDREANVRPLKKKEANAWVVPQ